MYTFIIIIIKLEAFKNVDLIKNVLIMRRNLENK